jgi:cellulose synthase/poly-beta-1,6-N-acetylglucosamine synthase-like glycosyltransferase
VRTEIGEAAGKVWAYLDAHGQTTVAKLKAGTKMPDDLLQQAIGWLAREDKIVVQRKGRTISVSLC